MGEETADIGGERESAEDIGAERPAQNEVARSAHGLVAGEGGL